MGCTWAAVLHGMAQAVPVVWDESFACWGELVCFVLVAWKKIVRGTRAERGPKKREGKKEKREPLLKSSHMVTRQSARFRMVKPTGRAAALQHCTAWRGTGNMDGSLDGE